MCVLNMKEELLHLIWSKQLFNPKELCSVEGESIEVLDRGIYNQNDGPDFLEAKIKVDNTILVGSIELHIKTSDWVKHNHCLNKKYNNVILHVVWLNDVSITTHHFPTLELTGKVSRYYLDNYNRFLQNSKNLPCAYAIKDLNKDWLEEYAKQILNERFEQKMKWVKSEFIDIKLNRIYEVFMVVLGMPQNKHGFIKLAQALPYSLIRKYKCDKHKLEALLFGVSGLLDISNSKNEYVIRLKATFKYLSILHKLTPLTRSDWVFLRIRPMAFPTVRLALLADLFYNVLTLEEFVLNTPFIKTRQLLNSLKTSEFWMTHYVFDKTSKESSKSIGKSTVLKLWINAIIPLRMLYSDSIKDTLEEVFQFLKEQPKEHNRILSLMGENGFLNLTAFDSQFNLHLYKYYCIPRKCLNCGIGYQIIRKHD